MIVRRLATLATCIALGNAHSSLLVNEADSVPNANHIFNAITNAMRQFGSSLHHNGMSFFVASVPIGTHFYHGTKRAVPVIGTEWLAFEPEHAIMFGRRRVLPPEPPQRSPDKEPEDKWNEQFAFHDNYRAPPEQDDGGYLHTYKTLHDLRLLYIDGMGAAKSDIGTMDSQTYILTNVTNGPLIWGEFERAKDMCHQSSTLWDGRIDGFIRMETGFEIILCKFEDHVELIRLLDVSNPVVEEKDIPQLWFSYFQAVTSRYWGIGGSRVSINFDDFVTAFTFDGDLFFNTTWQHLPRLNSVSNATLADIRLEVDRIARSASLPSDTIHWQDIADMIVSRYAPRVAFLRSGAFSTASSLRAEARSILAPFYDPQSSEWEEQITACADESIPSTEVPIKSLAERAIRAISRRICTTLYRVANSVEDDTAYMSKLVQELAEYLDWPVWKQCRGCGSDEICNVPMWPFGTIDDWKSPGCANATTMALKLSAGYWGPPLGGKPRGGPERPPPGSP